MKPHFSLYFLALSLLSTVACQQEPTSYGRIDVATAQELLQSNQDIVILDVRTPEEHQQGSIPGASLLDFNSGAFAKKLDGLDPDETYLVYCRSGGRSSSALEMMNQNGFSKVYELQGGFLAWDKAQQ